MSLKKVLTVVILYLLIGIIVVIIFKTNPDNTIHCAALGCEKPLTFWDKVNLITFTDPRTWLQVILWPLQLLFLFPLDRIPYPILRLMFGQV